MKPALVLPGGHLDWCPWTRFNPSTVRAQAPGAPGVYVIGVRTLAGDECIPIYVGSSVKLQNELLQYAYTYYTWYNTKPLATVLRRIEPERHAFSFVECGDYRAVERELIGQYRPELVNVAFAGTHPEWSPSIQARRLIERFKDPSTVRCEVASRSWEVSYELVLGRQVSSLHRRSSREYGLQVAPDDAQVRFEVQWRRVVVVAEVPAHRIGEVRVLDLGELGDWSCGAVVPMVD